MSECRFHTRSSALLHHTFTNTHTHSYTYTYTLTHTHTHTQRPHCFYTASHLGCACGGASVDKCPGGGHWVLWEHGQGCHTALVQACLWLCVFVSVSGGVSVWQGVKHTYSLYHTHEPQLPLSLPHPTHTPPQHTQSQCHSAGTA